MSISKTNIDKLISFGFVATRDGYKFSKLIMDDKFELRITINDQGEIKSDCYELALEEKYAPFYIASAYGSFAGNIKELNYELIEEIKKTCFGSELFKGEQMKRVIEYVLKKYGSKVQPWDRFPSFACLRRNDNQKWYGLATVLDNSKFGLNKAGKSEVLILKTKQEDLPALLKKKGFFPAYGLSKKYWFTIVMNGTIQTNEILKLIDQSYEIIGKK